MHSCLTQRRPIEVCRQPERLKHRSHLESFSTAILLQYSHFPFACENGKTCERKSITARQSNGNGSVYSSGTALEKNVSAFASRAKCASPLLCESVSLPDIYSSFHPMLGITFDSEYASNFFLSEAVRLHWLCVMNFETLHDPPLVLGQNTKSLVTDQ